jgi:adenine-specific DNA-methyltransferase
MSGNRTGKKRKKVEDYRHESATRLNNPTAALAREDVAPIPERTFSFDPHLDPQLVWAGKAERETLEVEAPSIHVHERLSTEAIVKAARRENAQVTLFADPALDRATQVEFYEHEMGWANRLILGDSLVVMTSLLERERMAGHVQAVYIDPPYGINYASNFQPSVTSTNVKNRDDDLTREPEQIQAYRDTWQLGVHSYLTYLRERLVAARELLANDGSVFVQIGDERVHLARLLLDEIFGPDCFCSQISFRTKIPLRTTLVPNIYDHILWYSRSSEDGRPRPKFRRLFRKREIGIGTPFDWVELPDGTRRKMTDEEARNPALLPAGSRAFTSQDLVSAGRTESCVFSFEFEGVTYPPPARGNSWATNPDGMKRLIEERRIFVPAKTPRYVFYADDYPVQELPNIWTDTQGPAGKRYVVQTATKVVERCILMTTDPGDLVLDPTCGGGTTAYAAERFGRRWITIDTSRVAIQLTRERLLTSTFDYFRLVDATRGVASGFRHRIVPHVTLGSITRGETPQAEVLYDQPDVDSSCIRVSGPYTVEALSRYSENPFEGQVEEAATAETAADHVSALLDALRTMGVPRKGGPPASVVTLEPLAGAGALHAEGRFIDASGSERPFAVSLGPRHGSITVAQIDEALAESPGYDLIVFAGFAATAEAQEYLAPGRRGRVNVALLEANADLLLGDLLKNTTASQTFRLYAAPEAKVHRKGDGETTIELLGMDTFDAATGEVTSRSQDEIAAWFLDHDYDGSVFHVNQAFFTRSNAWEALGKALKGTIDEEVVNSMHSFTSLPFKLGPSRKAAIRVVDDAGQTSEAILDLEALAR